MRRLINVLCAVIAISQLTSCNKVEEESVLDPETPVEMTFRLRSFWTSKPLNGSVLTPFQVQAESEFTIESNISDQFSPELYLPAVHAEYATEFLVPDGNIKDGLTLPSPFDDLRFKDVDQGAPSGAGFAVGMTPARDLVYGNTVRKGANYDFKLKHAFAKLSLLLVTEQGEPIPTIPVEVKLINYFAGGFSYGVSTIPGEEGFCKIRMFCNKYSLRLTHPATRSVNQVKNAPVNLWNETIFPTRSNDKDVCILSEAEEKPNGVEIPDDAVIQITFPEDLANGITAGSYSLQFNTIELAGMDSDDIRMTSPIEGKLTAVFPDEHIILKVMVDQSMNLKAVARIYAYREGIPE